MKNRGVKDWPWWKVFTTVQPLIKVQLTEEQMRGKDVSSPLSVWYTIPYRLLSIRQLLIHFSNALPLQHNTSCYLFLTSIVLLDTSLFYMQHYKWPVLLCSVLQEEIQQQKLKLEKVEKERNELRLNTDRLESRVGAFACGIACWEHGVWDWWWSYMLSF